MLVPNNCFRHLIRKYKNRNLLRLNDMADKINSADINGPDHEHKYYNIKMQIYKLINNIIS